MASRRIQRRAAILAAALVCLLVVMLLSGAIARAMAIRQRSTRLDEQQVQCFWLAESAALRATAKSRIDPGYAGEEWQVTLQDRDGPAQGIAKIEVQAVVGQTDQKQIHIEARWPDDPVARVLCTKEFTINFSETGVGS